MVAGVGEFQSCITAAAKSWQGNRGSRFDITTRALKILGRYAGDRRTLLRYSVSGHRSHRRRGGGHREDPVLRISGAVRGLANHGTTRAAHRIARPRAA